jgi:hypothetical protein
MVFIVEFSRRHALRFGLIQGDCDREGGAQVHTEAIDTQRATEGIE